MKCPQCQTVLLVMSERNGVEIDYCPQCRGVWLDRGELDKIIERSSDKAPALPDRPDRDDDYQRRRDHGDGYHRKKKSFWSELFD